MFTQSHILHEQLYEESYGLAALRRDVNATLDVALCYGYGRGVARDWKKCVDWLAIAAYEGNGIALLWLKRLYPELQEINVIGDAPIGFGQSPGSALNVLEALAAYAFQQLEDGSYEEIDNIVELLQKVEPQQYSDGHTSLIPCCCELDMPEVDDSDYDPDELDLSIHEFQHRVVNRLWKHLSSLPNEPVPSKLMRQLTKSVNLSQEYTLVRLVASCRHPVSCDVNDTMRRMGEILIRLGCPVDSTTDSGVTPLILAFLSHNDCIIDLLLQEGVKLSSNDRMKLLKSFAGRHDYDMLHKVLNSPEAEVQENSPLEVFKNLLLESTRIPKVERRLKHGNDYQENGRKTIGLILQYGLRHGVTDASLCLEEIGMLVKFGNDDLFEYLFVHFLQPSGTLSKVILTDLLIESIIFVQPEIFSYLLDHGADVNFKTRIGSREPWYPLNSAARIFGREQNFFYELIRRGADVRLMEDQGASILDELIRNATGADAIKLIIEMQPQLVHFCDPTTDMRMLDNTVLFGYPSTLLVLLEAGADFTGISTAESGYYALEAAIFLSRPECIENLRVLLSFEDKIASPGKENRLGYALIEACRRGNITAVEILLDAGAEPLFCGYEDEICDTPIASAWCRLIPRLDERDWRMVPGSRNEKELFQRIHDMLCRHGLNMDIRHGKDNKTSWEYLDEMMRSRLSNAMLHELEDYGSGNKSSWQYFDTVLR